MRSTRGCVTETAVRLEAPDSDQPPRCIAMRPRVRPRQSSPPWVSVRAGHNSVRVAAIRRSQTQGSRCAATLGWRPRRLWRRWKTSAWCGDFGALRRPRRSARSLASNEGFVDGRRTPTTTVMRASRSNHRRGEVLHVRGSARPSGPFCQALVLRLSSPLAECAPAAFGAIEVGRSGVARSRHAEACPVAVPPHDPVLSGPRTHSADVVVVNGDGAR